MILHHYTSMDAFNEITRTRTINASDPWTTMDAAYGRGWYFTDITPDKCRAWTVAYCWRRLDIFTRVEAYLKFDIPEEVLQHCREHVYMLAEWDSRIKYLDGGPVPKCPTAVSCIVCHVVAGVKKFFGWK